MKTLLKGFIVTITPTLLLSCYSDCYAINLGVEIGVGGILADEPPNGIWYQREFEHEFNHLQPTARIGLTLNNFTFGYRYLGNHTSYALATGSDTDYIRWKQNNHHGIEHFPLSEWHGDTNAEAVYLTYDYHIPTTRAFLTAGVSYHHLDFTMTIPNLIGATNPEQTEYKSYGRVVVGRDTWKPGLIVGAGYNINDKLALRGEIWDLHSDYEYPATIVGQAYNASITWRF